MRKEMFRMDREGALALLGRTPVVHLASTTGDGEPLIRTLHAAVVRGALAFHAAPVGEKTESVGRPAVVAAEEIAASVPSYFMDPERACPATTLYRSAQVHGVVERVDDPAHKAEVLSALMTKYQPEGGHVPIAADHPLYEKAVAGILVLQVPLDRVDGKAKLGQNRRPEERRLLLSKLWERGLPGDPAAVELVRAANPDTPLPGFLLAPGSVMADGVTLTCAPGLGDADAAGAAGDADAAADLVAHAYWNGETTRDAIVRAHRGSAAWVGARDGEGRLVATARATGDTAKRCWIYDVMVAPGWRGRGLGAAVVRLLLDHPAVRHARRVYLGTRDAEAFYERLGFGDREMLETRQRIHPHHEMVLIRPGLGAQREPWRTGVAHHDAERGASPR